MAVLFPHCRSFALWSGKSPDDNNGGGGGTLYRSLLSLPPDAIQSLTPPLPSGYKHNGLVLVVSYLLSLNKNLSLFKELKQFL